MLIPITLSPSSSANAKLPSGLVKISNDELVLVELQGSLEVEAAHPSERNGKLVGKLKIDDANKPSLLIGNHLLEGKIAALPKPYAVLRRNGAKRSPPTQSEDDDDGMAVDSAEAPADESSAGWAIVGIVKKKIIFSKRPMPVMGKKM